MRSFVTDDQKLSRVDVRGKNDPRPKTLMQNPHTFGLMFKDHYKYDNKNLRADFLGKLGKYDKYWKGWQRFREKAEREKQKILSEKDNRKPPDYCDFDENDEKIFRDKEGKVIPSFRTNDRGELLQYATDDVTDLNPFWETADDTSNSPEQENDIINYPQRKEADPDLNEIYSTIETDVNKTTPLLLIAEKV